MKKSTYSGERNTFFRNITRIILTYTDICVGVGASHLYFDIFEQTNTETYNKDDTLKEMTKLSNYSLSYFKLNYYPGCRRGLEPP